MNSHAAEVRDGQRFEFGKNWRSFLRVLDADRIATAEASIRELLEVENLQGKTVIDIGCGSGLFSLAARNLGARVLSFDYDPESVACAKELHRRFHSGDEDWVVREGSVLDGEFLDRLGTFDVVYSWGVLHHTGRMWQAIENAASLVKPAGLLFIAIYNDQGGKSRRWRRVKQIYCSGLPGRWVISLLFIPYFFLKAMLYSVLGRQNLFARYRSQRGMSILHDWFDWLGGLPFEVAKPEEVFLFLRERGFRLDNLRTTQSLGTNQFVFARREG